MGLATQFSAEDQAYLLSFGTDALNALLVDDVWTEAVERSPAKAAGVGRMLAGTLVKVADESPRIHRLLTGSVDQLNAIWPDAIYGWLSEDADRELRSYVAEFGGLGDASVHFAKDLKDVLTHEASVISGKAEELEAGGLDLMGDMELKPKVAMAIPPSAFWAS